MVQEHNGYRGGPRKGSDCMSGGMESMAEDKKASERQVAGTHYRDMAIQPGEFIVRNKLGWHEGNAIKYICRHRLKGKRQDIEKAIHYLQLLIEWEYEDKS